MKISATAPEEVEVSLLFTVVYLKVLTSCIASTNVTFTAIPLPRFRGSLANNHFESTPTQRNLHDNFE